jgi:uncharacterized protein YjbJ (UPF0337 family)
MENQIAGGLSKVAGRVEDGVGAATADSGLQLKGKVRQLTGQAQQQFGNAVDSFREQALVSPITTVAVAVGVGFLLGAYWAKRD